MKTLNRLVLGVLSSLLLAAGFVRAADQMDPISRSLPKNEGSMVTSTAPDCSQNCDVADSNS